MPHGTGHHHHHHHHHAYGGWRHNHHLHHRHTQIGYYGGGPYWYNYRRRPVTWIIASIVFTVLIIVSAAVTVCYTAVPDYTANDGLNYAPTDTRVIPVSNAFCQYLELTVDTFLSSDYTASLSMLDSPPKLTGSETFSLYETPYLETDITYYNFYMYPGSNFTLSSCVIDSGSATFYLIKGNKNFKRWKEDSHAAPTKDSFKIGESCSSSGNVSHSYHIKEEDYYYLVFDGPYTQLKIYMTFHRTRYEAGNVSATDVCTVVGTYGASCAVSVPLSGKTAFLSVTPLTGTIDWTGEIGLETRCVARVWMYAVISVSVFTVIVSILVLVMTCIIIKLRKKSKATPAVTAADNAPLLSSREPPTDPYFQQPPSAGYGSNNYTAPPGYKP